MVRSSFLVETELVRLAVTIKDGAVTHVRLHGRASRGEETLLERRAADELRAYLSAELTRFSIPIAPAGTAFERRVWDALQEIPYGETRTYGEIAQGLGSPQAARAVGSANHKNPIPIIIPCHRVVAAGGGLGGYGGGLDLKRQLLALETASLLSL